MLREEESLAQGHIVNICQSQISNSGLSEFEGCLISC